METEEERLRDVIKLCNDYLLEFIAPQSYRVDDPANAVLRMDRRFFELCHSLEERSGQSVHDLTTFAFFSKVDYYLRKRK